MNVTQPNCFELFGYDVLVDEDLRPWLLEANSSPSLSLATPLDEKIKKNLIRDTIQLVDPVHFDRAALADVLIGRTTHAVRSSRSSAPFFARMTDNRDSLYMDLYRILQGQRPRVYGEMPKNLGQYHRLAPSKNYYKLIRLRNPGSVKQNSKQSASMR
ncbi:hypothetical protein CBR_g36369 [Chara braunii]|uniref:Tubulin--tyrosine ligase-like protein 9 n=1 Tax=Chara braunii TaxID=69332 RepID=A0A388LKK5_CHABU|nr:hypothetical protein CBR_g36369 [Chara braunii]|eukprot:GBG82839.1 hypothetical protein CBR_g36369 [Chara braunii]